MPTQQMRDSSAHRAPPNSSPVPNSSYMQEVWPFFSQLQRDHTTDRPLRDGNVGRESQARVSPAKIILSSLPLL